MNAALPTTLAQRPYQQLQRLVGIGTGAEGPTRFEASLHVT
mgnify:CR=1 FL=1